MPSFRAVIFDLGGVVLGSPLHAIAAFEEEHGIPAGFINHHVAGSAPDGAWHRLERGEVGVGEEFFRLFDRELQQAGREISSRQMMERIRTVTEPRPVMLEAIDRLRAAGLLVAALTNNWSHSGPGGEEGEDGHLDRLQGAGLKERFDHFLESSVLGLRKPDPEIYRYACRVLDIEPREAVFLDDIGANLKSARALGMTTLKVDDPETAIVELEEVVGLVLRG